MLSRIVIFSLIISGGVFGVGIMGKKGADLFFVIYNARYGVSTIGYGVST